MTNCDGRCRGGWAFGQGFDSPQVHNIFLDFIGKNKIARDILKDITRFFFAKKSFYSHL